MVTEFRNEPLTDFTNPVNQQAFFGALNKVASQLGQEYLLRVGGRPRWTGKSIVSRNPADSSQAVGVVARADAALADEAVRSAARAFESWKRVQPAVRARILYKAAAVLRRRKHEFSAWLVYESGKTWVEADADTAEAIDFLEFYGREAERLAERQPLTRMEGEDNELVYIPLGVGVVIPPWNFPLAIMAGMTAASLVCGNTVVLKPASPTPVIAAKFLELLDEAGLPREAVQFIPGNGSEVGDVLVDHPLTRFISFTGSREVGLRINERAARAAPGQKWIKRVIAEMGGKDAIIVDSDCDVELAAESIVASAFGYSGQKCSACSRAIVHQDVYEETLNRVLERTAKLAVGNPADPGTAVGPVIDEKAREKIMAYIEFGKQEGRLVAGGTAGSGSGHFVRPTVFADVTPDARIAREEIFGPVLAFIRADHFDDAIAIANGTDYGLTGAVFSRNREHLEQARKEFHVGNLYLNRKCTGALVGAQPFGGFNMSGTDSKAGGRDYLHLFTQAKVIAERL